MITGTAEALATLQIYDGATLLGSVVVSAAGDWTFTPVNALTDGSHRIAALAIDAAGNASSFSLASVLTIDATAPLAPSFEAEVVAQSLPLLRGTAEAGSTVKLSRGGVLIGSGPVDTGGFWRITLTVALTDGVNLVSGVATDRAGNTSTASVPVEITYNAIAPGAPVFAAAFLTRATATPLIEGTAGAGHTVVLSDAGNPFAEVTAGADGKWSYLPPAPLSEGFHALTARARSGALTSVSSGILELRIDTLAPRVPTLSVPSPNRRATPTISGTAEAAATIKIYDGAILIGATTSFANGTWTYTPVKAFTEGEHRLTVLALDAAGNESPRSAETVMVIDMTAPLAPVPAVAALFNSSQPSLVGRSEALARITLVESGVTIGEAYADASGNFSLRPTRALAEGTLVLSMAATDTAGNAGPAVTKMLTIDLTAPAQPTIVAPGALRTLVPTLRGTAEAGSAVTVSVKSVVIAAGIAQADGTWSLTAERGLIEGEQTATVVAIDLAGNRSATSASVLLAIDLTPPAAPQIAVSGTFNVPRPAIAGTAEALATVRVQEGSKVLGTAVTDEAGQWSVVPNAPFSRGLHTVTAFAIDAAGNESPVSAASVLTITLVGPSPPVITSAASFNVARPVIAGTAELNTRVKIYEGATLLGTADTSAAGLWSVAVGPALTEGVHALTAAATDLGNEVSGQASEIATVTIDLAPPNRPVITPLAATAKTRPLIAGTAEAAATVVLKDGSAEIARFKAANDGTWSFTPETALAEGIHPLTAVAQDAAGNTSLTSTAVSLVIDTIAPPAVTFRSVASPGKIVSPQLGGTAEAGATVKILSGSQVIGTTTASAAGEWSFTVATSLADGAYTLGATATDTAGNTGPKGQVTFVIDTTPPSLPTVQTLVTISPTPVLRGTYDAGDTDSLSVTVVGKTYTSASGAVALFPAEARWQLAVPLVDSLREGTFSVTVVARDQAGNTATDPSSGELVVGVGTPVTTANTLPQPSSARALQVLVKTTSTISWNLTQFFTDPFGRTLQFAVVDQKNVTVTKVGNQITLVYPADFSGIATVKIRVIYDSGNLADAPIYALNFIADADDDGIADSLESALGDANGDGQPDYLQTGVASFVAPSTGGVSGNGSGAGTMSITLGDRNSGDSRADRNGVVVDPQGTVKNVSASSLAEFESAPETWTAVSPVIQFEIANATLQPDGTVVVIISLPVNGPPPQHVYKYGYEFASSTVKSFFLFDWDGRTGGQLIDTNKDGKPDIVRLVYRDGERGDDDLLVNGIIVDPIVFGSELEVTAKPAFAAAAAYFKGVLPTLSGTSVPLATIKIYDGGGLLGAAVASAGGTWSYTPQTALSEGVHTFGATATLPPAQPSDTAVLTMVLDSIAPAAPAVLGGLLTGSTTLVQGTAEAASTVTLYSAGQELGRSVAGANGAWSISAPIAYGTFILTATATDPAGNVGPVSSPFTLTSNAPPVNTLPSVAVAITLGNLTQSYDGKPKPVSVVTNPPGVAVAVLYSGSANVPSAVGVYPVFAMVTAAGFTGSVSGTHTITAASQTIALVPPARLVAGSPVTLAATASSGLPLTFTLVSGAAKLTGNVLTPTAAGTVVVRVSQAGDASYKAVEVLQTLLVAAETIVASAQTITFATAATYTAGTAVTLSATASSGLPVIVSLVSGPAKLSGGVLTLLDVGTVVLRASQAGDAVYQAATLDRTVNVVAATYQTYLGSVLSSESGARGGDIGLSVSPGGTSATLLLVLPSSGVQRAFTVVPDAAGNIVVELPLSASVAATGAGDRTIAAAPAVAVLRGTLRDERFSGTIESLGLTFNVARTPATGATAGATGFYRADLLGAGGGSVFSVVGSQGQALVVVSTADFSVGALATLDAASGFATPITTPTGSITVRGAYDQSTGALNGGLRLANGVETEFAGLREQQAPSRRLINLSSRTRVGGGEQTLISGFVVGGSAAQTVLIRGIGPALTSFGLDGALASPRLRLFRDGAVVAENSGWSKSSADAVELSAAFARLGAFALPANSADAALLVTLPAGAYTLHVDGGDGVALAEIYDAAAAGSAAQLLNVSTRGNVGAGAAALIGGFVVAGNTPQRVLVRAIGLTLQSFGVQGALADPRLTVYRDSTIVAENDNWGGADTAAVLAAQLAVGAFPLPAGSKDAVLLLTLAPGAYTAQVSGVGAGEGVALVEIYQAP